MARIVIRFYAPPGAEPVPAGHEGKFLQLVLHDQEYLLFAASPQYRYHNQILARFCEDNGLPHRWLSPERLEVNFAALTVVGGGRFRVNADEGLLELWDNSQAYGRFDARFVGEKIASADHPWRGFRIVID